MSGAVVGEDSRRYQGSLIQDDTFKKLTTLKAAVFEAFIVSAFLGLVVWMGFAEIEGLSETEKSVILITCQCFLWILNLLLDCYYKWRHHFLKLNGHFSMFKQMSRLTYFHFQAISFWNALILLMVGFMNLRYHEVFCVDSQFYLQKALTFCILSEISMLLPTIVVYAWRVKQFNKLRPVNDIDQYECSSLFEVYRSHEINFGNPGDAIANLLERQADLLFYYKAANNDLCQRLSHISQYSREM